MDIQTAKSIMGDNFVGLDAMEYFGVNLSDEHRHLFDDVPYS